MNNKTINNIVAVTFLLIFVAFLGVSMSYGGRTRLVPIPIAVTSIILVLLQLYYQNIRPDVKLDIDTSDMFLKPIERNDAIHGQTAATTEVIEEGGKESTGILLVGSFLVLIMLVGIIPATFLYVFGYCRYVGKNKSSKALSLAVATSLALFLLFDAILKVNLYEGWLLSLL